MVSFSRPAFPGTDRRGNADDERDIHGVGEQQDGELALERSEDSDERLARLALPEQDRDAYPEPDEEGDVAITEAGERRHFAQSPHVSRRDRSQYRVRPAVSAWSSKEIVAGAVAQSTSSSPAMVLPDAGLQSAPPIPPIRRNTQSTSPSAERRVAMDVRTLATAAAFAVRLRRLTEG